MTAVAPARLDWRDGRPWSAEYRDIFYAADGADETRRTFLEPTSLLERAAATGRHTLTELGFGTGLNFAVTASALLAAAPAARLHYLGVDLHPLAADDFRSLARRRGIPVLDELADGYPPLTAGWHRRHLAGGRVTLSLFFGDVAAALDTMSAHGQLVDTWYLDGFAPDRNPRMWANEVFTVIDTLSAPGAVVASFSVAGAVRRALAARGFQVTRLDQMPHKRHTLAAVRPGGSPGSTAAHGRPSHVTVAGAGFAGASVARHLADRGVDVTVYDPQGPAAGASGLPVTGLHARLLADGSPTASGRLHAFDYARAFCAGRPGVAPTGALHQAGAHRTVEQLAAVAGVYSATGGWLRWQDAAECGDRSRYAASGPGIWLPGACAVDGRRLIRHLLDHPRITFVRARAPADADSAGSPLVVATGVAAAQGADTGYLELTPVAGQLDRVRLTPPAEICLYGDGYLAPAADGTTCAGATYEYHAWPPGAASTHNLERLEGVTFQKLGHHRGMRAVSSDRTPVVGQVFDRDLRPVEGLLVSTGHGSMGATTSHLAAEIIASRLTGELPPVSQPIVDAWSPLRFRMRQARRGRRDGRPRRA